MDFRELEEEGAGLAHNPLLDVKVGQLFKGTNLFGGKFGDAVINGDGFGEKTVADENLSEALQIIYGLKSLRPGDVELAGSHERALIARLILENLLVFGDRLRDLALIQQ